MLLSLLLTLTPIESTTLKGHYGRQAQAWLLKQVAQYDSALAEGLHNQHGMRPYTISSLIVHGAGRRGEQGEIHLSPANEVQLRITSLSDDLSDVLLSKVISNLPQRLRLKWSHFKELRLSDENQWDGQISFQGLVNQGHGASGDSVTLQFASPTAFRSGQIDMALPTPDQVWRSLWWRWNNFAPEDLRIDSLWPDFAANCLVASDFSLRSLKVKFKEGAKGAATGATGQATYRLLPAKHCGEYAVFREGADQVLRTLAGFALYSGVGHHTTIGLGQTRWLESRDRTIL